jgi:Domain of unknown function (DUF4296)
MKHKLKTYCSCLLCAILLFSCTYRPKGVISKQKMEEALYDVYLAQALVQASTRYALQESKDSLLLGVLAKHQITQAEFDSSIVWYSTQGETYFKINDRISKRLRDLQSEFSIDANSDLKLRKKHDGYTLPPSVLLGAHGCPSAFGFEIDSLKFGQTDTTAFDFNFKILGITSRSKAYATVCFEYRDTTVNIKTTLNQNTYYSFEKPVKVRHKLKKISGYIYVQNPLKVLPPVYVYDLNYKKIVPKPKPKTEKKGRAEVPNPPRKARINKAMEQ